MASMSAWPTWRVPAEAGAGAGGLVSQRRAEAGSAAEVNAALTRKRRRCTSALHRVVEADTVSVHPSDRTKPRVGAVARRGEEEHLAACRGVRARVADPAADSGVSLTAISLI